jgi:colicin import membrane protein
MRRMMGLGLGTMLAVACAGHHQEAKLDDSGLARLNEDQMQPVDNARLDLGRAQDAVAKAQANETDARARVEVAKSEREVGEAQVKRAAAQRDLLKKQYADKDAMAQADQDIASAQDTMRAQDLKLAYLNQNVNVAAAERNAAEARVLTQRAVIEQTKYQAMQQAGAPQTASVNPGDLDSRLAQARAHEANAQKEAAEKRAQAVNLYDRWEKVDARARLMAKPQEVPPPAPMAAPASN